LTNSVNISCDETLFEKTKRVLTMTHIYHLCIAQRHVLIPILIKFVKFLPHLITLKLQSLPPYQTAKLPLRELLVFFSRKNNSEITKLYLEEMNDIREFSFLWKLCPHLMDFKVDRINDIDIDLFLRTVLEENNDSNSIRSLCFHASVADRLIKYEQLCHFTTKRELDNIYLQRKLL
jgi:hypothetical protein